MTNESLIITNNFKIRFLQIHFTQKIQIPEQKKTNSLPWPIHHQEEVCHQVLLARHRHQSVHAMIPKNTHENSAEIVYIHNTEP